jgi:hypothetical protein
MIQRMTVTLALLALPLAGCGLLKDDSGGGSVQGEQKGAGTTQPLPTLPGRSPMPTLDEWNTQRKEVTVKGSSALNCETKIVREYLRVSCRGKNDTGGTPTTVKVQRGGRGEALTFAAAGVTSLIVPFVEGVDFAADFSWTDKSHTFTMKWPRGAPRPTIVGVFEGAKSPLDGTAGPSDDKLCACHKKVLNVSTCDDLMGGGNADCERTYGNDCEKLLACSRGEPGALPKCLPGHIVAFMGYCHKECGPGKPACPSGYSCVDAGGPKVCAQQL